MVDENQEHHGLHQNTNVKKLQGKNGNVITPNYSIYQAGFNHSKLS